LLEMRTRKLAQRGEHGQAAATAEALLQLTPQGPDLTYEAARAFALCVSGVAPGKPAKGLSTQEQADRERYAARAVELLRQAVREGYQNLTHMWRDIYFAPLRSREDFQQVVRELEQKVQKAGS